MSFCSSVSTLILTMVSSLAIAGNVENAAFIDHNGGKCGMTNDAGLDVTTNDTRIVVTNDQTSGTVHLKCTFQTTPTLTGKAWSDESFMCISVSAVAGVLITFDSQVKQTPKGRMSLTCHFSN